MMNSEARKRHATPPTPDALDAIRARVEAATPGPWDPYVLGSEGYEVRAERPKIPGRLSRLRVARCGYEEWEVDKANAEFIAHARTDIPLLLAALNEARAERVDLWECPECGFSFDACHTDAGSDDSHSCPACSEAALLIRATAAESARDAAEGAIERVRALAWEWHEQAGLMLHPDATRARADDLLAILDRLAPVTTDETEGGGGDE